MSHRGILDARLERRTGQALAAVAGLGFLLRAWPFLHFGAWRVPVDYDDGVYFSAAALLTQGLLPYRDFVFVHPPGLLLFLAPLASLAEKLDPAQVFSAARWLLAAVGGLNVYLAGRVGHRAAGPLAGLAAAVFYAAYPEAIIQERGPYLEPVLNLCCLGAAAVWLSPRTERSWRWAFGAGALLGLAFSVKVWALLWGAASLASLPRGRALKSLSALAGGAALAAAVVLSPFLLAAPVAMVEQTVLFHAWRPPDGLVGTWARLEAIGRQHVVITALALFGMGMGFWRHRLHGSAGGRHLRFFTAVFWLVAGAFLAARAYWSEYNSHLAPAETALAGLGAAELLGLIAPLHRRAPILAGLMLLASPLHSLRHCLRQARNRDDAMIALGAAVRRLVPKEACLLAFEPIWGLTGGRLPSQRPGVPPLVDSYGTMLLASMKEDGRRFPHATEALHTEAAQRRIREILPGCGFLAMGWRGHWQLTEESKAWLSSHYVQRHPLPGEEAVDIWEEAGRSGSAPHGGR